VCERDKRKAHIPSLPHIETRGRHILPPFLLSLTHTAPPCFSVIRNSHICTHKISCIRTHSLSPSFHPFTHTHTHTPLSLTQPPPALVVGQNALSFETHTYAHTNFLAYTHSLSLSPSTFLYTHTHTHTHTLSLLPHPHSLPLR